MVVMLVIDVSPTSGALSRDLTLVLGRSIPGRARALLQRRLGELAARFDRLATKKLRVIDF